MPGRTQRELYAQIDTELSWSESDLPERERTKHVHRLHPYLGKYPPQLYSSPPQQAPKTKTPPGQQKKKDSSGTGGGTAAPPGQQ